jgi:epoxyqueuosine reductase QueG
MKYNCKTIYIQPSVVIKPNILYLQTFKESKFQETGVITPEEVSAVAFIYMICHILAIPFIPSINPQYIYHCGQCAHISPLRLRVRFSVRTFSMLLKPRTLLMCVSQHSAFVKIASLG